MDIQELKNKAKEALKTASNLEELQSAYKAYLGKKGEVTLILRSLAELKPALRKTKGKEANELRDFFKDAFKQRSKELRRLQSQKQKNRERIDVTAPGKRLQEGHLHPLTQVQRKAQEIFQAMGFVVVQGPEIETEWYNFDALNIPADHPARDMWNTFWLKQPENSKFEIRNSKFLLRTHTSPVQARYMETHQPPLRIVVPGRVFRYEAIDAHHLFNFYQLEGLMVGKNISVGNFKAVIQEFYRQFFEKPVSIRLRPSYFPFTEPSFEIDMRFGKSDWLEMMGAGMVHPNVFKTAGYIPRQWTGFAFGMGLDRLCMMKYKIPDIRLLYSGDLKFLQQF
ncbi:MAG: phenylalanine--tRNA ligase subunit alpha [Patescibacteria group bacterium]